MDELERYLEEKAAAADELERTRMEERDALYTADHRNARMPRLPHDRVHLLKAPKPEYVAGLHVHTKLLHGRRNTSAPQALPPKAGRRRMDLRRS